MADDKRKERVKTLIDSEKTPWSAEDQTYLESLNEERFTKFEAVASPPDPEPKKEETKETPKETPPAEPAAAKTKTEEEWMKEAPESIRTLVTRAKDAEDKKRTELVAALKTAQDVYTEDELKEMEIEKLEKLVKLASASPRTDFSGKGNPRSEENVVPSPPSLSERFKTANKAS